MHKTRLLPRLLFIKFRVLSLVALLFLHTFTDFSFSRVLAPTVEARGAVSASPIPADIPSSGDPALDFVIYSAGLRHGVDPRLLHAVIWQESRYKTGAVSHKNAQGLMQMIPATAKRFGCADPSEVESNVEAGTKYLRWLLKRFDGDVTLALAAYNAGEGNVDKHEGVPPFDETQKYVRIITGRYGKNYHPVLTPEDASSHFNLLPRR